MDGSLIEALADAWHGHRWVILVLAAAVLAGLNYVFAGSGRSNVMPVTAPSQVLSEKQSITAQPIVRERLQPRRIQGRRKPTTRKPDAPSNETIQPIVFYATLGGSTEAHAHAFCEKLSESCSAANTAQRPHAVKAPQLLDLSSIDLDDYFTSPPTASEAQAYFYMILLPTYNIDTNLLNFLEHLRETHFDFRVDTGPLRDLLGFSVFGFGDREEWPTEEDGFCSQAVEVDKWMARLTNGKRAYPLGMGDAKSDYQGKLDEWRAGIERMLLDFADGNGLGEGLKGSGDAVESDDDDDNDEGSDVESEQPTKKKSMLEDVEALGLSMESNDETAPIDFTTYNKTTPLQPTASAKPMVPPTSPTYTALTKQGYSIIGSHSGIKLCRWTKSALRGRGSCYKHSFYGIASHCCMECTPSLSCSNKCVFCWRHGTNPVGTSWRWSIDPPEEIFAGVTREHHRKIKVLRGVPGVRAERFEEALRIRHCALSLVGEPIFYPHINAFLGLLHAQRISSFLVCNAQHPAQLAALHRVTQLYVSIDAADAESLRKIDRPLHRDFWQRFVDCLDILREERFRQRTVFRLTLVKGFNLDEAAAGYAALVQRGLPCFIEVKGVTYCGTSTSKGAGLTMANVPFYAEVVAFVEALNRELGKRGLEYGIGAEHAHSCCILLASRRFYIDDKWHTSIDYGRFFDLLESGEEFKPEDYCAPTVEWALWGNGGFDPADVRAGKKGKALKASDENDF